MNAENQEETYKKETAKWYEIKEGKFNEKDTEMVQLTKIILKQTSRHIIRVILDALFWAFKELLQNDVKVSIFTKTQQTSLM